MLSNYINGEWVPSDKSKRNINPSDIADTICEYAQASPPHVEEAVRAAETAFAGWRETSPLQRHDILQRAAREILARREELGRLLSREEGKPLAEGIGEVTRAGQVLDFFAGESLRLSGDYLPSVRTGVDVEVSREPVGVVGIITPWNFPIAIPAWKIAPALAYGNTVVFKPADLVPASAWHLVDVLNRAGLPKGVLNLVMGSGSMVGKVLLGRDEVAAVSFTGSVATGRAVAGGAVEARRMKKLQMEMGGKNPLVILDDADLGIAVECAVSSAFFSTGQRCTAASRFIVSEAIHDRFVAAVIERMKSLVVGDALHDGTDIGPVVDKSQLQQDLSYIEVGKSEGARLACGGEPLDRKAEGYFLAPALFTEATNAMRIAREEIFGPVATVIRVKNYEEALAVANDTDFGLSSGICTTSLKHASHFKRHSQAGMVMVNLPTAGVDFHVPFGGRKNSSYGPREQGSYAREFYTNVKTSYVSP